MRVKICGITNLEDAAAAAGASADALGFIFYRKSPRFIEPGKAREIIRSLGPFITTVGVFVNEPSDEVNRIVESTGCDVAQLHGDETPEFCASINTRVIKVVRIRNEQDLQTMPAYDVSAFLLDTYREGVPGGTGETFNWDIARKAREHGRIILSGGLKPENVEEAVRAVHPYAVDVSSGVESAPGRKDHGRVLEFIKKARKPSG